MKQITRARPGGSVGTQRLNVGLTLLALIFLTVMVAAAGIHASRPTPPVNPRTETLAVLGVAPSSGSASTLSAPPAVRPARPARTPS
ncbi:MAG: hypothetical protein JO290_00935 [Sphingomonadaceae bacterium]|nr:hypothetical protein [Sphingomonadaceae bacterium]